MKVSDLFHVLAALLPNKFPHDPLNMRLRWVPKVVWTLWRRENSYVIAGKSNHDLSVVHCIS